MKRPWLILSLNTNKHDKICFGSSIWQLKNKLLTDEIIKYHINFSIDINRM